MSRQGGGNFTKTIIDIGAAGALTSILATGPVVYFEIVESQLTAAGAPNVPQGVVFKLPNDNFTQEFFIEPGNTEQIGDRHARHAGPGGGSILGNGTSFILGIGATPASVIAEASSSTGTPTSIEVTQWYS